MKPVKYHELLSRYIDESKLSLGDLVLRLKNLDIEITKSYISKLKNGNKPPASEDITRALAEVTGGDPDALVMAAYMDKAPVEVKDALREAERYRFVFKLIRKLMEFIEFYYEHQKVQETLMKEIQALGQELQELYKRDYSFDKLNADPGYALQLIGQLRSHFFPQTPSITIGNETIDFAAYLNENGIAKQRFPRPVDHNGTSRMEKMDPGTQVTQRMLDATTTLLKEADDYIEFLENTDVDVEFVEDILKDVLYLKRYMNKLHKTIDGLPSVLKEVQRAKESAASMKEFRNRTVGVVSEEAGEYLSQAAFNGKPKSITDEEKQKFEAKRRLFEEFNGKE